MSVRARSLVARVVVATASVAVIAGLTGASLAGLVAYYFLRHDEDARLSSAAEHARYEFVRDGAEAEPSLLPRLVSVEASEIERAGLVIGVVSANGAAVGTYRAGRVEPGRCVDRERAGHHFRACAAGWGDAVVVVASADASVARFRHLCLIAALCAAALSMLGGLGVSRRVARSALAPLTRLHQDVVNMRPGAGAAALGPHEDVLEVDALRAALAGLLGRQALAVERSQNFAADAAHELRTPLTTLRAKVDMLLEQAELPASQRGALKSVQGEVERLALIVERLLVLAMPEEDGLPLARPLSVVDLVEEVTAALPAAARERIRFVPAVPELAAVRADAALLELALANLIDNALKYSSEPVTVRVEACAGAIAIVVEDGGPGIPADERELLLLPFRRGAATRHVRGHGIGLAIVAKVAAAHGGSLQLEGVRGLRVRLALPALTGASHDPGLS